MSYSDFTLSEIKQRFGITIVEDQNLFPEPPSFLVSERLTALLADYIPLATSNNTEKARSEWIIAPILAELKRLYSDRLSLFSGIDFTIDASLGLTGRCDYIVARSAEQLELNAPVVVVVEAKNENMIAGIPQCLAEMIAAQRYNQRRDDEVPVIYGTVTTGSLWRFLKLEGSFAYVDRTEYPIQQLNIVLGILVAAAIV